MPSDLVSCATAHVLSELIGNFQDMTHSESPMTMPLDGLEPESMTPENRSQVAVMLLWAISRARMGHDTTTRYLSEQTFLDDYLAPFAAEGKTSDSASAWASARSSAWWASDVPSDVPLGRAEVLKINPAGGLLFHLVDVARDDDLCGVAVRQVAELLPAGDARDDLLYGFALDQFLDQPRVDEPDRITWPGVLDAEVAAGSHELASAAAVGDWEAVLELLRAAGARSMALVNTWRPGGKSLVTPLHQAAIKGAPPEVVEQLIEMGAWRSLADSRGWRPLELALLHGRDGLVSLLEPQVLSRNNSAPLRVLTYRLEQLLNDVTKEDAVPRFRAPQAEVIAETGGEIEFDLAGSGHYFSIFLQDGELLVEHKSAGNDDGGIVYRVNGTGVVDTWENEADDVDEVPPEPSTTESPDEPATTAPPIHEAEAGSTPEPTSGHAPGAAKSESESGQQADHDPSLSGVRTLWSDLGDCAITVVPRALVRQFNRERKRGTSVLVITVSEFKKGRRWESVASVGPVENLSDETVAGKGWSYAIVVEVGAERDILKQNLRTALERQAESGLGPRSHEHLVAALENRHGRKVAQRVETLWAKIHELAVSARVDPQRGNEANPTGAAAQPRVVDARERRGMSSNLDASTGGAAFFDPPIRMAFESANFSARADWNGETIIVKAGSAARKATLESMPPDSRAIRKDLLSRGVIREVSGRYIFNQDCRFRSVSSAASMIAGRTAGGRVSWKDSQDRTINDILGGPKYRRSR